MYKSEKTCTVCGATFTGGAGAMYCPSCKRTKNAEMERERRKNGSKRKIGSTAICEKCGAEYTVKGALQKYCDECRPERKPPKAPPKIEIVPTKRKRAPNRQREVKCAICGEIFYSTGSRATYCPSCQAEHRKIYLKRQNEKRSRERSREGKRSIGTEATCANCGEKFVIEKSNQKFCQSCREKLETFEKSEIAGVYRTRGTTSWKVMFHGSYIGTFRTREEAIEARKKMEEPAERRRCVICGKEIPFGKGYHKALTCSSACRKEYKKIRNDTRFSTERGDSLVYASLYVEIPVETKARVSAEAQARKCTIAKYIRDLIQKEFDRLDEAKGGGDDERK